jgi:hypothetical protein
VADAVERIDPAMRRRIDAHSVTTDRVVAGHDVYPVSVHVHGDRGRELTIADRISAYEAEARRWHARYGRPFWVAETSNLGLAVEEGERWLVELTAALDRLAGDGLPVRGICWYSRGDQFDWHTMLTKPIGEVTTVGLFDHERRARPVAGAFAALAAAHAG